MKTPNTPRDIAMNYLSRREHTRPELRKKLLAKKFSPRDIDAALDQLAQENLQSDARFAENYVRYRTQQGFGPLRIIAELRARGISDDLIDQYVDVNAVVWKAHMQQLKLKKFAGTTKNFQQQCRFLLQRGFSPEMVLCSSYRGEARCAGHTAAKPAVSREHNDD